MPPKQKEKERKAKSVEFAFVLGVDLFSRYGFVKFYRVCRKGTKCEKGTLPESKMMEITEEPDDEVGAKGYQEDLEDDGKATGLGGPQVIEGLKEWFKKIEDMGYDLPTYFISDRGTEYDNNLVEKFLKDLEIIQGFTVPNDKLKNPIVERFMGTFKRLLGQYMLLKEMETDLPEDEVIIITPKEAQELVDFYNNRIHSATGYAPNDVLNGDKDEDSTLFNYYRTLKSDMYLEKDYEKIEPGTVVRIYNKWKTSDKNIGDKKSNIPNWSATLYRVKKYNKLTNTYELEMIGKKDKRDRKFEEAPSEGLRQNFLQPIDYEAFQEYSIS